MLDNVATKTSGSAEWWLLRLGRRLADDAPRFDRLEAYWRGNAPMPHGNRKMRESYRRLQAMSRTNFGNLIAETVLERMQITGFRAGGDASEDADKEAWGWWQHNGLDADSGLVHRAAVIMSRSYVIVGEDPDEPGQPLITVEDPRQVIHESSPTNRRKVDAALKTWWDDQANAQLAVVYLPDKVHYFRSVASVRRDTAANEMWIGNAWDPDIADDHEGAVDNPLGKVPVIPFTNRPDMWGQGLGEYEDVTDVLDRINTVILDRMVISAMQAYRQRWAKGVSLTDENGNDNAGWDPGADLLWAVEDETAQFGEFSVTDVTPIVKSAEADVQYLAAITRTPPHYLLAGIVNASGDALSVAETGLVSKLLEREREFGESWEAVYRLVAKQQGRELGADCEVLWRDPQFRTLAEMAAAAIQLKAADVPWRTRMRMLDMTPSEIERMEAERAHDAMMAGLAMAGPAPLTTVPSQQRPEPTFGVGYVANNPDQAGSVTPLDTAAGPGATGDKGRNARRGPDATATNKGANWDELYARARAAGIKGASKMTVAELRALVGN